MIEDEEKAARMALFNFDHGGMWLDKMHCIIMNVRFFKEIKKKFSKKEIYELARDTTTPEVRHFLFGDILSVPAKLKSMEMLGSTMGLGDMRISYDLKKRQASWKIWNGFEVETSAGKKTCTIMCALLAGAIRAFPGFGDVEVEETQCTSEGYNCCEFRTVRKKVKK